MPELGQLVITSADYKIQLSVPNAAGGITPFILRTVETLTYDIQEEDETVHAVGTAYPIAEKSNAKTYGGTLVLQAGEANAILLSLGLNDWTQLKNCELGAVAIQGAFARVFHSLNYNSERLSVRAKDKMTMITSNWKALGVNAA